MTGGSPTPRALGRQLRGKNRLVLHDRVNQATPNQLVLAREHTLRDRVDRPVDDHQVVRLELGGQRKVRRGDHDGTGRNGDLLYRHVLQVAIGAGGEPATCGERGHQDGENAYARHASSPGRVHIYWASFRISAVARMVSGSPALLVGTTNRATGCSTMNSNG